MTPADLADALSGIALATAAIAVLAVIRSARARRHRLRPARPPYSFEPAPITELEPVPGHWSPVIHADCDGCGYYTAHEPAGDGWATCHTCGTTTHTTDQE